MDFEIKARTENMPSATTAQRRQIGQLKRRITRDSMREWRLLTQEQRQDFVDALSAVRAAKEDMARRRTHAKREDRWLSGILKEEDPRSVDWKNIIPRCSDMTRLYRALIALQGGLANNYCVAFADIVTDVYTDEAVGQYALDELLEEQGIIAFFENREEFFRRHTDNPDLPPREDGKLKFPEYWLPSWKRMERAVAEADRQRANFPGSADPFPLGPEWEGGWEAPDGGMSSTSLWIQFSPDDRVIGRMFRKNVYETRQEWSNGTQWDGDDDPNHPQIFVYGSHYSEDLKDLIDRCLNFDPGRRPAFEDILNEIDAAIQKNLTNGRKDATRGGISRNDDDRLEEKMDDYAIDLARVFLPPLP